MATLPGPTWASGWPLSVLFSPELTLLVDSPTMLPCTIALFSLPTSALARLASSSGLLGWRDDHQGDKKCLESELLLCVARLAVLPSAGTGSRG